MKIGIFIVRMKLHANSLLKVSNYDVSFTSLLPVYLVISSKFYSILFLLFFIYMLITKERPVRVFIDKHLFFRGREMKVVVFRTAQRRL